jgi:O-antigen ligase
VTDSATLASVRDRLSDPAERATLIRSYAGPLAAFATVAWWLVEVTRSWAGRDGPSVTVGAALLALAVLLNRPDQVLPRRAVGLAAALSVGAFIVPLTAPSGWAGAKAATLYVSGTWLCVLVATVIVRRPEARHWTLVAIAASAPIEFVSGWLGWWGGANPTHPMVGTFYWHDSYAAFLVPGGIVGLALFVWGDRLYALLGVVSFAFASMGVVYSTSRAALACFIAGTVAITLIAAISRQPWRALRQCLLAVAIGAGCVYLLAGPPFFSHRVSPFAAEHARTTGQSLGQNGGYRLEFWHEALAVFKAHPLTGGGYKSMVAESIGRVPDHYVLSPYAHNGYLQAISDGGLVLAVPFLLAVLALAYLAIRAIWPCLRRREVDVVAVGVPIAIGLVFAHSAVDFDWTYAANFAMAGVLAGVLLGHWLVTTEPSTTVREGRPRASAGLVVTCLAGAGLLVVSAWVMRNGDHRENLPTGRHVQAADIKVEA